MPHGVSSQPGSRVFAGAVVAAGHSWVEFFCFFFVLGIWVEIFGILKFGIWDEVERHVAVYIVISNQNMAIYVDICGHIANILGTYIYFLIAYTPHGSFKWEVMIRLRILVLGYRIFRQIHEGINIT